MSEENVLVTQINFLIGSCVGAVIENYIIVDFLVRYFGYKRGRKHYHAASVAVWLILFLIALGNGEFQSSTYILPVIAIAVLCIYCHIYLNGKMANQILCCLTPFLIITVINTLVLQLSGMFLHLNAEEILESTDLIGIMIMLFTKLVFFICMQFILLIFKRKYIGLLKNNWLTVVSVLIISILIYFGLYYLTTSSVYENIAGEILVGISVGILVMDVYIYRSILNSSEQSQQMTEYKLLRLQNEEQAIRIQNLAEHENRLDGVRHDFKNHLLAIQSLVCDEEYNEAVKYIQRLTEVYLMEASSAKLCNNPSVNAVLGEKFNICKKCGIVCRYNVIGDFLDFDGVDLSILLFNLLDNAIEASLALKKDGLISLEMRREKEYITLHVKNRIDKSVLTQNPELETTKPDEDEHGLGHINVDEVVRKHDGMIDYYEDRNMFCVYIMLKDG